MADSRDPPRESVETYLRHLGVFSVHRGGKVRTRTAYSDFGGVKIGLVAYRGWTASALQLIPKSENGFVKNTKRTGQTLRLGTFRTLSGYFLTYFFLPLLEWRAQTSLTWSLKRGGTALDPWVSPLTNSTIFSSSSFALQTWKAARFSKTRV